MTRLQADSFLRVIIDIYMNDMLQAPLEDIYDVVDREYSAIEAEALYHLVASMLPSTVFRGLILLLIIANAVIIGIQTDERLVSVIVLVAVTGVVGTLLKFNNYKLAEK